MKMNTTKLFIDNVIFCEKAFKNKRLRKRESALMNSFYVKQFIFVHAYLAKQVRGNTKIVIL